jgi:hypothetical protein
MTAIDSDIETLVKMSRRFGTKPLTPSLSPSDGERVSARTNFESFWLVLAGDGSADGSSAGIQTLSKQN